MSCSPDICRMLSCWSIKYLFLLSVMCWHCHLTAFHSLWGICQFLTHFPMVGISFCVTNFTDLQPWCWERNWSLSEGGFFKVVWIPVFTSALSLRLFPHLTNFWFIEDWADLDPIGGGISVCAPRLSLNVSIKSNIKYYSQT